jgi:hypothetical protein
MPAKTTYEAMKELNDAKKEFIITLAYALKIPRMIKFIMFMIREGKGK